MRIRHSTSISIRLLALPAATAAVIGYFAFYAIWGERGALAFETAQAQIGVNREELTQLEESHGRLRHRIALMSGPNVDADLVEEIARGELLTGAPHQVAIERNAPTAGRR